MTQEDTIQVCTKIIENWKDKDRTAFIDSLKQLSAIAQYSNQTLNKINTIVGKVLRELSTSKDESHKGYMEEVLDFKKKLKEKELLMKKKQNNSAKKQVKSSLKEKKQNEPSQKFGQGLSQSRKKFAKFIHSCFIQNFQEKYDPSVLQAFILELQKEINDMFEGDSGKVVKHLQSMKINFVSPKSSFAKGEMLQGNLKAKQVATNKTAVFQDKSGTKKADKGERPAQKEEQLTGNGEECPKCQAMEAYCYMMQQIRASDEPMTRFLKCRACKDTWTD